MSSLDTLRRLFEPRPEPTVIPRSIGAGLHIGECAVDAESGKIVIRTPDGIVETDALEKAALIAQADRLVFELRAAKADKVQAVQERVIAEQKAKTFKDALGSAMRLLQTAAPPTGWANWYSDYRKLQALYGVL